MSVKRLKVDAIDAAQKYKVRYKQTLDPNDLDMFKRFMDVYNHLDDLNDDGSTGTTSNVLIDGGTFTAPNNALIDAGGFV